MDPNFSHLLHFGEKEAIKSVRLRPYSYDPLSGAITWPAFETFVSLQQAYWDFRLQDMGLVTRLKAFNNFALTPDQPETKVSADKGYIFRQLFDLLF